MRSRTRKFKAIGLAGMLVVGLTAGSLPAEPVSAENGWEEDLSLYAKSVTASSVTISIGSSGNATLSPGRGSNGTALGTVKRTASVQLGATDGYTIKVSGNPNLTGNNANNKIASVSSATTLKQMSNQWGWYSAEGDVSCDEAGTYRAMSTAGETVSSGVLSSAATKTVTMCFGANVSTSQAADNYSNTVTVSAVAEPRTVITSTKAFGGITYMQDMTVNACQNASVNETAQLIDRRDSKKYWVTKLLDGNCWMSQNLDFNISTNNVTTAYSDVTSNWTSSSTYPARATYNNTSSGSALGAGSDAYLSTYSWDVGDYIINNPAAWDGCGSSFNGKNLSTCTGAFTVVGSRTASMDPNFYKNNGNKTYTSSQYDAHYLVGNYYQWNAAAAGTNTTDISSPTAGSICPKGWKLPTTYYNGASRSFTKLFEKYGLVTSPTNGTVTGVSSINSMTYDIALSPLFFVRSGYVYPYLAVNSQDPGFGGLGIQGFYWSATNQGSSGVYGDGLEFWMSDWPVFLAKGDSSYKGYSVRCMVSTIQ